MTIGWGCTEADTVITDVGGAEDAKVEDADDGGEGLEEAEVGI